MSFLNTVFITGRQNAFRTVIENGQCQFLSKSSLVLL